MKYMNPDISEEHRAIINESLQAFASHEHERISSIGASFQETPTLESLQQSPLGQMLAQMAETAEQGLSMPRQQAKEILIQVYQLLRPLAPADFDDTHPLGKMLNHARVRILDLQDILTVTEASKQTGIGRAQIYLMIEVGYIHPVLINNHTMIERGEIGRVASSRKPRQTSSG